VAKQPAINNMVQKARHALGIVCGAFGMTLLFFCVLPLMQTISRPLTDDLFLQDVDLGNVETPPPPAPPEEEPEEEPELDEQPPELTADEAPPLDLSQLELALNPGAGQGWMGGGDFAVKLNTMVSAVSKDADAASVFSMADLDQKPRPLYQPGPVFNKQMRRNTPATVYILFLVDEHGRVMEPRVQKSTNPLFDNAALNAVKRWKFEPGKRNGKAVRFRMRVPITFPK